MKYFITAFAAGICLLACNGRKVQTEAQTTSTDTALITDNNTPATSDIPPAERDPTLPLPGLIQYQGPEENSTFQALITFSPLQPVYAATERSISFEDSIKRARNAETLTEPGDSLLVLPPRLRAYDVIMAYKRQAESGFSSSGPLPRLVDLKRTTSTDDSTYRMLPQAKSTWLSSGNFFFVGGAPFMDIPYTDKDTIYTDPSGRPETRFVSTITENANYAMASLLYARKERIRIRFGQPLMFYYGDTWHARGIGRIIHEFAQRIPAFFLTENGAIPADLIDITVKVHPENRGCVSDQPTLQFACRKNLSPSQILAVFIPFDQTSLTSAQVNRLSNSLWTADLNNDGTPDIACVSSTFEGIISDTMAECLWYVNIDGSWRIIDWGKDLECT